MVSLLAGASPSFGSVFAGDAVERLNVCGITTTVWS